jgi:hypothetical protein
MSSAHAPALPLAFSAEVLATSIVIGTSTTVRLAEMVTHFLVEGTILVAELSAVLAVEASKLAVASAKGLNEVKNQGSVVGQQLGKENLDFLSTGATMSASMTSDLAQGAKGELIHGVKEGGRLFSTSIDSAEVVFERCGTAIIGKFSDPNQAEIDKITSERIAAAYQMIMHHVGDISVGKDSIMLAHKKSMENTQESINAINAEANAIQHQMELMENERREAREAIQTLDTSIDDALKTSIEEANEAFSQTIAELNQKITAKEQAHTDLHSIAEAQRKIELEQNEQLEVLEQRMAQSQDFVKIHRSRIREHTTLEIQRIMSEHGMDDPTIELSEGENNQIRLHIEE